MIVESAAKAKTIRKYLNSIPELRSKGKFEVIASLGHIQDLPVKTMGVDLTTWDADYVISATKKKIVEKLKSEVKKADVVYLASDEDTEGEAIAFHLQNVLHLKPANTHRITFHEITKPALTHAVLHPRSVDMHRVAAQESRRILDRVVGYELSPLLWKRFATSSLSAGRVQSCVLKIITDRAKEIVAHEPVSFWTVEGSFHFLTDAVDTNATSLRAKAYQEDEMQTWDDEASMQKWLTYVAKKVVKQGNGTGGWKVAFRMGESKKNPPAPFTTSTLQQEAYARLGLPSKRTMQLAQGLYEGGYITYMRTDSVAIAEEAQANILKYIQDTYGKAYAQPRKYKTKAKNAQEAHECIRVTDPFQKVLPSEEDDLTPSHRRLYELIWRRTVATQMSAAVYNDVFYTITSQVVAPIEFRGKTSLLVEEGYLKVYGYDKEEKQEDMAYWKKLLKLGVADVYPDGFEAEGDVTRPPSLFTEPTIVKTMEKEGIGRPSTFATIIDKLFEKGYISKGSNPSQVVPVKSFHLKGLPSTDIEVSERSIKLGGTETDRLVPTSLGERVVDYLEPIVPFILDRKFTSMLEGDLDTIMDGKSTKQKVLDGFYKKFHPQVEKALDEQKKVAKEKRQKTPDPKDKASDGPKGPKNVLKEYAKIGVQLVKTRFGPALYRASDEQFVSVTPYLEWKNKAVEELTEKEVKGLYDLPWTIPQTMRQVAMGKYGLYLKDGKDNIRLPKELWQKAFDHALTAEDVQGLRVYKKKE